MPQIYVKWAENTEIYGLLDWNNSLEKPLKTKPTEVGHP
jgi:hypothetical protein